LNLGKTIAAAPRQWAKAAKIKGKRAILSRGATPLRRSTFKTDLIVKIGPIRSEEYEEDEDRARKDE
jgi:hypothetical protein